MKTTEAQKDCLRFLSEIGFKYLTKTDIQIISDYSILVEVEKLNTGYIFEQKGWPCFYFGNISALVILAAKYKLQISIGPPIKRSAYSLIIEKCNTNDCIINQVLPNKERLINYIDYLFENKEDEIFNKFLHKLENG